MNKVQINPILKIDPTNDYSLLTAGDTTINDRTMLLQRIQILQLQNTELKKRQEYLKMINATLLQALGNKKGLKETANKLCIDFTDQFEVDHMNKMNSFKKKAKQRKTNLDIAHKRSIQTIYIPGDCVDPNSSYKNFEGFYDQKYSPQKSNAFSKTKSPIFQDGREFQEIFRNRSATPKNQNRFSSNKNSQTRKSVNSLIQPLKIQNSFSKKSIYLPSSARSQISNKSINKDNKNIATALLCDLCGMSYSPLEFMTHARNCKTKYQYQPQLNKITDRSFQEQDSSDQQNQDLLEVLQHEKAALLHQINRLKRSKMKNSQQEKDQIVLVLNNKNLSKQKTSKSFLKQKSYYSVSTARKR